MHGLTATCSRRSWKSISASCVILAMAIASIFLVCAPAAFSHSTCQKVASPSGSDRARGTESQPYRTVGRLVKSLRRGETGCLRGGVYSQDLTIRHGGTRHARMVLRSYPGESATILGRLYIARAARYTTLSYLHLVGVEHGHACGTPCPSPTVNADHTAFVHDDVTDNHTAICFLLGDSHGIYGPANFTVISDNRIHDCGVMPPGNHDHGIYIENSYGSRIVGNWIYNNADRGIQFYPEAMHTLVRGNVIDNNGEGLVFGAIGSQTSSHNLVERNVITDARVSYNVSSYYRPVDRVGRGNVVRHNCIGGGPKDDSWSPGGIERRPLGFSVHHNVLATASFARRAVGALDRTSACERTLRLVLPHPGP